MDNEARILLNGCWDLAHVGHFNALRQVAKLRDELYPEGKVIAGIHANEEIARVKGGSFIYTDSEKLEMLRACNWVDDVIENVPYVPVTPDFLDKDFVSCAIAVHGDDPVILADGTDMYRPVREAGRYAEIRRSEGVSTTSLINRILTFLQEPGDLKNREDSGFQATGMRFAEFYKSSRTRLTIQHSSTVVYLAGHFDLFHPGHVEVLRRASKLGDFLLVGLLAQPDSVAFLTDSERALSLLACRYVGDVVLEAPDLPSSDFVSAFNVSKIVHVVGHDDFQNTLIGPDLTGSDLAGPDVELIDASDIRMSKAVVIGRVLANINAFKSRNKKKINPPLKPVCHNRFLTA